jgi:hypothetical protein
VLAVALEIIFGDLARVGDDHGRAERRQPLRNRYQAFARPFHFLRLRSRPSTFSATGIPNTRGHKVKIAFAALQYSATSDRCRIKWTVEKQVWTMVSKYLWRQVVR